MANILSIHPQVKYIGILIACASYCYENRIIVHRCCVVYGYRMHKTDRIETSTQNIAKRTTMPIQSIVHWENLRIFGLCVGTDARCSATATHTHVLKIVDGEIRSSQSRSFESMLGRLLCCLPVPPVLPFG